MKKTRSEVQSYTNVKPGLVQYKLDFGSYDIEVQYPQTEVVFHPKEGLAGISR